MKSSLHCKAIDFFKQKQVDIIKTLFKNTFISPKKCLFTECSFVPRVTIAMNELGFDKKYIYETEKDNYNNIKNIVGLEAQVKFGKIQETTETNFDLMYLDVSWNYNSFLKIMEAFARNKTFSNKCLVPAFISKRGGFYPTTGINYENELRYIMNENGYEIEQLKISNLLKGEKIKNSVNGIEGTDWHYNRGRGSGYVWKVYLVNKIIKAECKEEFAVDSLTIH